MYLLSHHGSLDSVGHRVHTGGHLQVIQSLILFANGILSIDPRSLLVSLFKSLHDACVSTEIIMRKLKWCPRQDDTWRDANRHPFLLFTFFTLAFWALSSFSHFLAALSICLVENYGGCNVGVWYVGVTCDSVCASVYVHIRLRQGIIACIIVHRR